MLLGHSVDPKIMERTQANWLRKDGNDTMDGARAVQSMISSLPNATHERSFSLTSVCVCSQC